MALPLRFNTASQEIWLGPFLDDTDGKTAKTALTIANTDIKIYKSGATAAVNKNSGGATHDTKGWYFAVLDATDTNTLGQMEVFCFMSSGGALPVRREYTVYPQSMYDWLFMGSGAVAIAEIADGIILRPSSAWETQAVPGMLGELIIEGTHKADTTTNAGYATYFRSNGSTQHRKRALTTDTAAAPITGTAAGIP